MQTDYKYFVSYTYRYPVDPRNYFGEVIISTKLPVTEGSTFLSLKDRLNDTFHRDSEHLYLKVLNFQLLSGPEGT